MIESVECTVKNGAVRVLSDGSTENLINEWDEVKKSHLALLGVLKLTVNATRVGSALRRMCDEVLIEAERLNKDLREGKFVDGKSELMALLESHRSIYGAVNLTYYATREGSELRQMCEEVIKESKTY